MDRKISHVVAGVVLAGLCWTGQAWAATWREQSTQEFPLAGVRALWVENTRGAIEVRAGTGNRLHLTAVKSSRAGDESTARRYAGETEVETRREDDAFVVAVRYPNQGTIRLGLVDLLRGREPPWVEIRLTLEVPENLELKLRAASGDLSTTGMSGPQTLESSSGDASVSGARAYVEVRTASGEVHLHDTASASVRSTSGDVDVEGAKGPLWVWSTSGGIQVQGATDSLELRTVSGDIQVESASRGMRARTSSGEIVVREAKGWVDLETSSGEIQMHVTHPFRGAEVTSVTGDIVAWLGEDVGCTLDLRTSSGDIEVLLPFKLQSVTRHEISGVIRGGKAPLTLKSSAGDIELRGGGI